MELFLGAIHSRCPSAGVRTIMTDDGEAKAKSRAINQPYMYMYMHVSSAFLQIMSDGQQHKQSLEVQQDICSVVGTLTS